MRILFLGGFGVNNSLRDLIEGFEALHIDYAYLPYMGTLEDPAALRQALDEGGFTAIIGFCPFYSNEQTMQILAASSPLKLMWEFDAPHREIHNPDALLHQLRGWDGSLTSSNGQHVENFYRQAGKPWWGPIPPPAVDWPLTDPELAADASNYTVTFIGQRYDPNEFPRVVCPRDDIYHTLTAHYEDRFGVFGNKWGPGVDCLPWYHTFYYWRYPTFSLGHHGEKDDHWYFNGRDTRAMGAGACYIHDRANQMDTFFEEGAECFFYESPQEIVDIVEEYRDKPHITHRVAEAGRRKVVKHFGQEATARRILDIIATECGVDPYSGREPGPLSYIVTSLGDEPPPLGDLWQRGQITDHYEFRPLGYPTISEPPEGLPAGGFRIFAFAEERVVGHVAVVPKDIGGLKLGGICGLVMEPMWQVKGATRQLVQVLKQVGRDTGYQVLLGWTSAASRFWAHAGALVRPGGTSSVFIYDRNVAPEALWAATDEHRDSW